MQVQRALLSVSEKEGIVEFAESLAKLHVELISTGGTAKKIREARITVTEVSDLTGFSEMLDGRVKTLHPSVHGGILAKRDNAGHMKQLSDKDIKPIDLVCVNLYPFKEKSNRVDASDDEVIEEIDIGGPTLIRAAAKNFKDVIVIVNPSDYHKVVGELQDLNGSVSEETRSQLAYKAFNHTARYDTWIQDWFRKKYNPDEDFPENLVLAFEKIQDLRYGENPYQKAAFYRDAHIEESCVTNALQLHGKKLSFNNILDINDAFELIKEFDGPTAAVIKHTNPCGVATAETIHDAYVKANEADSMSAFGGIIALNGECDLATAEEINKVFVEAVIAPSFDSKALEIIKSKKNIRVLETGDLSRKPSGYDVKKVVGGLLIQTRGYPEFSRNDLKVASLREPLEDEIESMLYAWRINRHIKSNSILFCKGLQTVGIGAGQMSRVDAVKIASFKAGEKAQGAVMASDAFFPFRDGIDEAAKAGIIGVIQPGGSIRDKEVVDAVNEHGMSMVFTGVRAFRH
ncbi:MAG: bifunctional phosphoribosylaminoimidazolecarboxamide formyltransferase/IMP cyclohydrolase [Methanobacteriota archaeon]